MPAINVPLVIAPDATPPLAPEAALAQLWALHLHLCDLFGPAGLREAVRAEEDGEDEVPF